MKLHKAINHICYAKNPKAAPKGVTQARWNAIYKTITNNWENFKKGLPK